MLTRVLAIYSSALTTMLTAFVLAGSVAAKTQSFDEIDVQRINVREPDGTLRLAISNRARLPGVIERGKEHRKVDRPQAGLLFYNDEGTENGGLVFGGHRNAQGEVRDSGGMLTFDRYAGSQIIQLAGVHDATDHIVGLIVSDTDDNRRRRVFVGATRRESRECSSWTATAAPGSRCRSRPTGIRAYAFSTPTATWSASSTPLGFGDFLELDRSRYVKAGVAPRGYRRRG